MGSKDEHHVFQLCSAKDISTVHRWDHVSAVSSRCRETVCLAGWELEIWIYCCSGQSFPASQPQTQLCGSSLAASWDTPQITKCSY